MALATSISSAIAAAVAIAGAAMGTAASLRQEQARSNQENYQSKLAERNAKQAELNAQAADAAARSEIRQAQDDAQAKRREAARLIGAQRARTGAAGAQVDEGSSLDQALDTAEKGEIDALSTEQGGREAAYGHKLQAWNLRSQAQDAHTAAALHSRRAETDYLGQVRTLLNGMGRMGSNFFSIGARGPRLS